MKQPLREAIFFFPHLPKDIALRRDAFGTWFSNTDLLISSALFSADFTFLIIFSIDDDLFFSNFIWEQFILTLVTPTQSHSSSHYHISRETFYYTSSFLIFASALAFCKFSQDMILASSLFALQKYETFNHNSKSNSFVWQSAMARILGPHQIWHTYSHSWVCIINGVVYKVGLKIVIS